MDVVRKPLEFAALGTEASSCCYAAIFKQTGNTVGYFNPDFIGTESNNNLYTTHRCVSSRIHFPETTQRNGAKMVLSITIEKYDHLKKDT